MSGLDWTSLSVLPGNDDWMAHPTEEGQGHPDFVVPRPFVRFDPETGRITGRGGMALAHIQRERLLQGGILLGDGRIDRDYVDLSSGVPTVARRTPCPAVLDGLTLSSLPVPCRIEISNPGGLEPSVYPWSAPALALDFEHTGTWTVRVLCEPHLPGVFTFTT